MSTGHFQEPHDPGRPLSLCVLASGSSGNCSVVRGPLGVMLIDAGIGPRTTATRLKDTGARLGDVAAICLTHLDSDHFSPHWIAEIVRREIRVHCHESRVNQLAHVAEKAFAENESVGEERMLEAFNSLLRPFDGSFAPWPGTSVTAIPLAHDHDGSQGFVVEADGVRIGYATDLGHVPPRLLREFERLDVLALESNYDPQMQQDSGRPEFLKRRITGGRGHLSNDQAFEAICLIFDRCQRQRGRLPDHVVLLHRSRQCNCPRLLRNFFSRDERIAPRLTLSEQFAATPWLGPASRRPLAGEQLMLAWG